MGEVYRAHDAKLDRRVALKLTLPGRPRDQDEQLRREAVAMARLAHPNVVAVHEVVDLDDRLAIVMELVEGQTARAWAAAAPRRWREVVDDYRAAGAGLAAIHRAGLVHRDVKPDNVLVGADGRVRVADLGLVDDLGGTAQYLAPEIVAGAPASPRSDQFSFCLALRDALAGTRPPARLAAALARGVAARPEERWPTMDDLLAELARDPSRARRRALTAAGAVAALGLALGAGRLSSRTPRCGGGAERLRGVWDAAARAAVQARFEASGRPFAADTFARVARGLDAYAGDLTRMHRDACEATAVRHEQSPALLDLRMACLQRRAGALGALVAAFQGQGFVEHAVAAAAALEPVADCADLSALGDAYPPPAAPLTARVTAARAEVDRALALAGVGRFDDALEAGRRALADARALAYPPVVAEALLAMGAAQLQVRRELVLAEPTLREAILVAAAARADLLEARAWLALGSVLVQSRREAEMVAQRTATEAAVVRAGESPTRQGQLEVLLGTALRRLDRLDEAREHLARAALLLERGGDRLRLLAALQGLANVRRDQGAREEARDLHQRTLVIAEEELGPEHPLVAIALFNLAHVTRPDEAGALYERAERITERVYGAESAETARVVTARAQRLLELGRCEEGLALAEPAVAVEQRLLGPDNPDVVNDQAGVGGLLVCAGDLARGRPLLERAVAFFDKRPGRQRESALVMLASAAVSEGKYAEAAELCRKVLATRPEHDAARWMLGTALRHLDPAQALAPLDEALAGLERRLGPESNLVASALLEKGAALRALGRAAEARPILERALAIRAALGPTGTRGAVRFELAQTLAALGQEERARAAAAEARPELLAGGVRQADDVRRLDAWLAGRAR